MKELLVEFLQNILKEGRVKAVKVDDSEERVVYFGSQKAAQDAITAGTHRPYIAAVDKNLSTDTKPTTPASNAAEKTPAADQPEPTISTQSSAAANEVFGSLLSAPVTVAPGVLARQIIDPETKKPVDVTSTAGRKRALKVIDEQLQRIDPQLKEILGKITNKESTEGQNVFKWLGNVGELHTLREILQGGAPAYLLPDSNPDNDIVIVRSNGKNRDVTISEISVKSSTGDISGGRGANARKSLHNSVAGKEMVIDGQPYNAVDVVDSSMATYIEFTQFFTDGFFTGRQRNIEVPNEDLKKFDSELLQKAITASKSTDKVERKGAQTLFLQSRKITNDDIATFEQHLGTLNLKPEHKAIMGHYLGQLKDAVKANPNFNAIDIRKLFTQQIATILKNTNSSLNFNQDVASVKFTANGFESVSIVPAETVRARVGKADVEEQMKILNFSLRTRALDTYDRKTKAPKKGYLGPIINMSPPSKILKPGDRLTPTDYLKRIGIANGN